jgi:hypothetical protein
VFNFIDISPELEATQAGSSKNVISVKVLGLQKLEPKEIMLSKIRQSPNPFCHEGYIQKSDVDDPDAPFVLWPAHFRPIHPVKFSFCLCL